MSSIPRGHYGCVLADPPWPYRSSDLKASPTHRPKSWSRPTGGVSSTKRYGALSIAQLCAMPIKGLAADNAHLYLWTTNAFMVEAHAVARAWGFEPKTIVTWCKHHQGDPTRPSMKMGYYFRGATEHCLFAVRGRMRLQTSVARPTWFAAPRGRHSAKPDCFRRIVEASSSGPYLELFAREESSGWDTWGNQAPGAKSWELTG